MLTGNTWQFQMAEWAFSCKDRTYLQQRFELPSALTSDCHFRDWYDRRQKYFNHKVRHPLLKSPSTRNGELAWWHWQQTQGLNGSCKNGLVSCLESAGVSCLPVHGLGIRTTLSSLSGRSRWTRCSTTCLSTGRVGGVVCLCRMSRTWLEVAAAASLYPWL